MSEMQNALSSTFVQNSTVHASQRFPSSVTVHKKFQTDRWDLSVVSSLKEFIPEVLNLRKDVYVNEWNIMNASDVSCTNDFHGIHVLLHDRASGKLAACTHMMEAEFSDFVDQSGLLSRDLDESVLSSRSTIAKDFRSRSLFQLLVYAACSYYRAKGKKFVVSYIQDGDHPTHKRFKMIPISSATRREVKLPNGNMVTLTPHYVSMEYAMHRSSLDLSEDVQALCSLIMHDEIEQTIQNIASQVNRSAIWSRAKEKTLTPYQYAEFLAQLHHFVRNTTRVIAAAFSTSQTKTLQRHFRKHLSEEIDHEMIIESDLKVLGMDVEFYTKHFAAHPGIWKFNTLQEALLSHRKNPILYMAVPFAVEGISAFISDENVSSLKSCIQSWGITSPEKVMRFLESHREFDGQDGGHWEMTLDMIKKYIHTEDVCKDFLAIGKATVENMLDMINDVASRRDAFTWTKPATLRISSSVDSVQTSMESAEV